MALVFTSIIYKDKDNMYIFIRVIQLYLYSLLSYYLFTYLYLLYSNTGIVIINSPFHFHFLENILFTLIILELDIRSFNMYKYIFL